MRRDTDRTASDPRVTMPTKLPPTTVPTTTVPSARLRARRAALQALAAATLALAAAGCAPAAPSTGAPSPGDGSPAVAEPTAPHILPEAGPGAPNPLLRLQRRAVEGGRAIELLAHGLRPDERMVEARLLGPLGERVAVPAERIRHGRSLTRTDPNPRVSIFGGSNTGVGVTLSLDVFGRRDPPPARPERSLRAWTRLQLPPGARADAWAAEAVIEDSYGRRQILRAG
jgi:hypothetical protein